MTLDINLRAALVGTHLAAQIMSSQKSQGQTSGRVPQILLPCWCPVNAALHALPWVTADICGQIRKIRKKGFLLQG